jgi:hypothetical protein
VGWHERPSFKVEIVYELFSNSGSGGDAMTDMAQWTIADAIQRIPIGDWWWIAGTLAAIFCAGFALAHRIQSRKLENTESELALERVQPRLSLVLGSADCDVGDVAHLLRFSFSRPEFIHPEIVEELEGWISDGLPVYAAVDLEGAMASNRFVRPVQTRQLPDGYPWVLAIKEDERPTLGKPYYMYRFVGATASGTHLVQTAGSGGGSGVFGAVLFMRFQKDEILSGDLQSPGTRARVILRCIGSRFLGDRYDGIVSYSNGILTIGAGSRIDIGRTRVQETNIRLE